MYILHIFHHHHNPHLTQLLKWRSPFVIGILPGGHFNHAYAQRPYIGSDVVLCGIALRIDAFRCHIWLAASVYGLGHRVNQVAYKAGAEENIRRS